MGAKRWYVVHVYSGFEKKIAERIKHQAAQAGLAAPSVAKRLCRVHGDSGFEKKIAERIKHQAAQSGLADRIDDILVPTEQVTEVRRGQKVETERPFFPGSAVGRVDMGEA